jgi:hypothetical protein
VSISPVNKAEVRSSSIHCTRAFDPVCIPAHRFALIAILLRVVLLDQASR